MLIVSLHNTNYLDGKMCIKKIRVRGIKELKMVKIFGDNGYLEAFNFQVLWMIRYT